MEVLQYDFSFHDIMYTCFYSKSSQVLSRVLCAPLDILKSLMHWASLWLLVGTDLPVLKLNRGGVLTIFEPQSHRSSIWIDIEDLDSWLPTQVSDALCARSSVQLYNCRFWQHYFDLFRIQVIESRDCGKPFSESGVHRVHSPQSTGSAGLGRRSEVKEIWVFVQTPLTTTQRWLPRWWSRTTRLQLVQPNSMRGRDVSGILKRSQFCLFFGATSRLCCRLLYYVAMLLYTMLPMRAFAAMPEMRWV